MKYFLKLCLIAYAVASCLACASHPIPKLAASENGMSPNLDIGVIELRNYLVKPGSATAFNTLFTDCFLQPMLDMGVAIPGRYKIRGSDDHFVWIRGYDNMVQRVRFLNDFYFGNEQWKKHKKEANAMIRNSDNVYLLRPLNADAPEDDGYKTSSNVFKSDKPFAVVDFYIANTRLEELKSFYTREYLPMQRSLGLDTSIWISETVPSDFPQLPVFQDKNLLVAITFYDSEKDFRAKSKALARLIPGEMKLKMLDIVTLHHQLLLINFDHL